MFNSLKYAKQLIEAGFSRQQAEAQMQIMAELLETKLAMKDDIVDLRNEMNQRFDFLEGKVTAQIRSECSALETRLIKGMTGIMAVLLSIFTALIKLT